MGQYLFNSKGVNLDHIAGEAEEPGAGMSLGMG
jgi:hypothetical protein